MLTTVKRWIRNSPFGPLATRVHHQMKRAGQPRVLALSEKYDEETVAVMQRVLKPDSCCVDIGAHQGTVLQHMLRLAPRGTHFAFEPLPDLATQLRRDFPAVRVHAAAVGERAGTSEFVHVENAPAYSGLRPRIYDRPDPILKRIVVDVVRIDDVIPAGVAVVFMKLDIEGGEFHALLGAAATIRRCRPLIVFEAGEKSTGQYGVDPDQLFRWVAELPNYRLSTMQRWLAGRAPYTEAEFRQNWQNGGDFYFIAYPANGQAAV